MTLRKFMADLPAEYFERKGGCNRALLRYVFDRDSSDEWPTIQEMWEQIPNLLTFTRVYMLEARYRRNPASRPPVRISKPEPVRPTHPAPRPCGGCSRLFTPKKDKTLTCSGTCRVKVWRQEKRANG